MSNILKIFDKKGALATVIGLLFALPINLKVTIHFYKAIDLTENQIYAALIMNIISMCWFILPSVIEIKSKAFTFIIKD